MRIKVSVTKGDIKACYTPKTPLNGNCPIAVATARTVKDLTGADLWVGASYGCIRKRELSDVKKGSPYYENALFSSKPSRSATRFMQKYDNNVKGLKPFNFFLNV